MKLTLPLFVFLTQYGELRGGEYRFKLFEDIGLKIPALAGETRKVSFRDHRGVEWAFLEGDLLTIRKGYAWNGASPKRWFLFRWIGTPDYEPTRLATLFHDVCFQFLWTQHWPEKLDISASNELFFAIMTIQKFRLANTYFGAVRDFGERFAGKYPRRGEHSVLVTDCPCWKSIEPHEN